MPNPNPKLLTVTILLWSGATLAALAVTEDIPNTQHPFVIVFSFVTGLVFFAIAAHIILSEKE